MRTSASVACPILTIHAIRDSVGWGVDSRPQPIPLVGRSFLRSLQLGALSGSQKAGDRLIGDARELDPIRNNPTKILCELGW